MDIRGTALETAKGPLYCFEISRILVQNGFNKTVFFPTLNKLCTLLYCPDSHTDVSERNSIKPCQTVGGVNRPNKTYCGFPF